MRLPFKVRALNLFRLIFQIRPLERKLASFTQGRRPEHFICKLVPNSYQYERPTMRDICVAGIAMRLDISDYLGHYYFFGFYDPAQNNLFSLCKPDSNVLDIGSNVGFTVLNFAKKAYSGRVVGFEPDPINFLACSNNLSLNNFSNVEVLNVGLGATNGDLQMEVASVGNRGGNRVRTSGETDGETVQIKRLDSFFPELGMRSVNLIKIDVEGYELQVLRGSEETIQKYKPVLFIELDDDYLVQQGDSAIELIRFLERLGYRSITKATNGDPLDESFDFAHCHFDIIAK